MTTVGVMSSCLFCRIVNEELPAEVVARGATTLAFRDINPVAPSHVLVIPRDHITNASELQDHHGELLAEMILLAQQVTVIEGIDRSGYRLVFNVGNDAGNLVPHLHLHIVGGRPMSWPPG